MTTPVTEMLLVTKQEKLLMRFIEWTARAARLHVLQARRRGKMPMVAPGPRLWDQLVVNLPKSCNTDRGVLVAIFHATYRETVKTLINASLFLPTATTNRRLAKNIASARERAAHGHTPRATGGRRHG